MRQGEPDKSELLRALENLLNKVEVYKEGLKDAIKLFENDSMPAEGDGLKLYSLRRRRDIVKRLERNLKVRVKEMLEQEGKYYAMQ